MSYFLNDGLGFNNVYDTTLPQRGPPTGYLQRDGRDLSSNFRLYVYGTRKASNYFIGNDDIGKYYQCDSTGGTTTYDLGAYNMSPWNVTDTRMANARWIWNSSNAQNSAPIPSRIWFYYTFYYSGPNNTGTLYACCDNYSTFYLNGVAFYELNGWNPPVISRSINILSGLNFIRVFAYNAGDVVNPAGLLMALYDSSSINIVNTSTHWVNTTSTSNTNDEGSQPFNT